MIRLNVGGENFCFTSNAFWRIPDSLLYRFSQVDHEERLLLSDAYDEYSQEYFFNRSWIQFRVIVEIYQSGTLHIPEYLCPRSLALELEYWGIDTSQLNACLKSTVAEIVQHKPPEEPEELVVPEKPKDVYQTVRQGVWDLVEHPNSSKKAMAFMILSCIVVLTATVNLILTSLPQFQYKNEQTNETMHYIGLEIMDSSIVGWFTVEYAVRLWAAPSRWGYVKSTASIIDLAAVTPYYIELIFSKLGIHLAIDEVRRSFVVMRVLRVLRVLRALRILKVARYSTGFQSVGSTLRRSWKELSLLVMFMLTGNLLFSTIMYYAEYDHPKTFFTTIPEACWWCVITMTTVGYGDVYPKTVAGKLLGGVVGITGIVLLAFPISVIVETFYEEYQAVQEKGPPGESPAVPRKRSVNRLKSKVSIASMLRA